MITAQGNQHFIDPSKKVKILLKNCGNLLDVIFAVLVEDWLLFGSTDSQDTCLWLVNDTSELFDSEHTQIGNGEGSTLIFFWGQFSSFGSGNQVLSVFSDFAKSLLVSEWNDWGDETVFDGDSE